MKAGTSQYFMPQFDFNTATPNASLSTKELPSSMPTLVTSIATKDAYYPRTDTQVKGNDYDYPPDNLEICVEGIPSTGAKSRVETQMKLSIKLVSKNGGVQAPPYWSYLRIPTPLLARSKLKKSQQQKLLDGSSATMVSDESKVLNLEARVVCESDEEKIIKMCQGCVRRERKRAERKKDANPSFQSVKPGVIDEAFERDRQRILLFNCEPLVNFSAGEAIIPTRITCYCRHHYELIGFRVRFVVKDDKGFEIASGETPPIMITDDHKTTQQRAPSDTEEVTRKRRRTGSPNFSEAEHNLIDTLITPASSRRSSMNLSEAESASSPLSTILDSLPPSYFSSSSSTSGPSVLQHFSSGSPLPTPGVELDNHGTISPPQTPITTKGLWKSVLPDNSFGHFQLPVAEMSNLHHRRTKSTQTMTTPSPAITQCAIAQSTESFPPACFSTASIDMSNTCSLSMVNDNIVLFQQSQQNTSILMQQSVVPPIPILNTISPSQGSTYGGTEVTITGQGFHQDLILMFGNRAATTIYWSPTSIVCLLPPAEQKGLVLLSFKEHSLMSSNETPPLFVYYKEGQQSIINLTHQVLSINYEHCANDFSATPHQSQEQDIELHLINLVSQHCTHGSVLSSTNLGEQNLLHMAAYLNYPRFIHFLLSKNPSLVQSQDRNGLSPLHFGCQNKSTAAIYALLKGGANVAHMSSIGTPMSLVAALLNPTEYQELETQIRSGIINQDTFTIIAWLPSLFVFATTQYYRCSGNPLFNDGFYTDLFCPQEDPLEIIYTSLQ